MAGRQLQRLLKDRLLEDPHACDHNSQDPATSSDEEQPGAPAFNPFDLLNDEVRLLPLLIFFRCDPTKY